MSCDRKRDAKRWSPQAHALTPVCVPPILPEQPACSRHCVKQSPPARDLRQLLISEQRGPGPAWTVTTHSQHLPDAQVEGSLTLAGHVGWCHRGASPQDRPQRMTRWEKHAPWKGLARSQLGMQRAGRMTGRGQLEMRWKWRWARVRQGTWNVGLTNQAFLSCSGGRWQSSSEGWHGQLWVQGGWA